LGWSTIALIRGAGRVVLIDGGSISMRRLLMDGLANMASSLPMSPTCC